MVIGIGLAVFICFILFCFFQVQNKNKTNGILNEDVTPEPTNVPALEEIARKKGGKYVAPAPTDVPTLEEIAEKESREYVAPKPTDTLPLKILGGEENSVAPAPIDEVIIDEPTTPEEPAESTDAPPLDESMIPEPTNIPPLE